MIVTTEHHSTAQALAIYSIPAGPVRPATPEDDGHELMTWPAQDIIRIFHA